MKSSSHPTANACNAQQGQGGRRTHAFANRALNQGRGASPGQPDPPHPTPPVAQGPRSSWAENPAAVARARTQRPVAPGVSPTTGRTEAEVRALLDEVRTREERFALASRHLAGGRYAEAKDLLAKLASEDPQSRRFRGKLFLVTGHLHREAGRIDEAVRELRWAAALEKEPGEAALALKNLAPSKGLLSRLLGR
jgi:hypothetical protein